MNSKIHDGFSHKIRTGNYVMNGMPDELHLNVADSVAEASAIRFALGGHHLFVVNAVLLQSICFSKRFIAWF